MDLEARSVLFKRVERITRIPMLVLSVVFLVVVALPFVIELSPQAHQTSNRIMWLIWAIFVAELLAKAYIAPDRRQYLRSHWPDILTVAIPWLRAVRVVATIIAFLRTWEELRLALRQRTFSVAGIISLITITLSSLLVYMVERHTDGPIQTFFDALWWSVATITTVGYGDVYPTTGVGRSVAVFLMITGISLFGIVAARVAAFFVQEEQHQHEDVRLDLIAERLERIEQQLTQLQAQSEHPTSSNSSQLQRHITHHTGPGSPRVEAGE